MDSLGIVRSAAVVLALGLGACGPVPSGDGLRYAPPAARGAVAPVALSGATRAENLAIVAARLRAAGFRGVATDTRRGVVTGRSTDPALVDCGVFIQTARGNTARFEANAPRSILFSDTAPGGIVTREVRATTDIAVSVDGTGGARIATVHEVRASQSPVVAGGVWRDVARFDGDTTGAVADRVVCTGSGAVGHVLAQR